MPYFYPYDTRRKSLYQPGSDENYFELKISNLDYVCAEFSRLSYLKAESPAILELARKYASRAQITDLRFFAKHNTQGMCGIWKGHMIYAFRGTQSDEAGDIITDINAWPVKWKGDSYVHLGFKTAFENVMDQLQLDEVMDKSKLVFTGHSLGGALAQLACAYIGMGSVFSFGSPRVGDRQFQSLIDRESHKRYVHCCDICPQLPPKNTFYSHGGKLLYIDSKGDVVSNPSRDQVKEDKLSARLEYPFKHFKLKSISIRELADHSMLNYSSAIAGASI